MKEEWRTHKDFEDEVESRKKLDEKKKEVAEELAERVSGTPQE